MKILVVDDQPDSLSGLRTLLEAEGHEVLQAANGIEALASLELMPVDAIISDILMPRMDGYRLCRAVRKNERWRTLPFIFYTATHVSPEDERLALDLGAHKLLKKPVPSGEIVAALAYAVGLAPTGNPGPMPTMPEDELISEYSERLVARLEKQHVELACNSVKLRSAHEKLRNLLAASPVVIYALRVESQGVSASSVSENLERMLGFTEGEALEPNWWGENLHPEDRGRMLARLPAMASEEQGSDEYRFRRKDGVYVWVRDDRRLVRDGQGRGVEIIGSWADITARKRAEMRTEVQHAVTGVLAEGAPSPETKKRILEIVCRRLEWEVGVFWILDRTAKVLRCVEIWHTPSSEALEFANATRSMVCTREEGLPGRVWAGGEPVWVADVIQSEGFRRGSVAAKLGLHGTLVVPVKIQTEVLGVIEFFNRRALPPDAELLALLAALGTQIGQFLERKQLEEQFRQSHKMEAIGQLAGGVAHDFNNLLTVIQGHTQLLLTAENLEPGMAEDLQQVFVAAQRAARLTSQLLTFSRKKVMQSRPVDLNEIVAGVNKMLQRIIGEDVALRIEPEPFLPAVLADPGMLEQVLMNLVVNARDAMRKGGELAVGTSRVLIGEAEARFHANGRPGEFVCLRVADTGCGMTPETMVQIFEPFFTTKALGKGTGLGLATVHSIVRLHQGWVEVESQLGEGTTFRLFFPAAGQTAQPIAPEAAASGARGGSETILVVEDEPAIRELTRIILERQGYRILEAGSGVAALLVWVEHAAEISLVITDMVMPDGMTGRELAEQLTARRPSLKVIYSTGYSPEALDQDLNLEAGLNYLPKPYDPRALARIVRKRLDT